LRVTALVATVVASVRWRVDRWVLAAAGVTLGLFVTPGASPHEVVIPLGLLAVAAASSTRD
jgi:hypothetical protein